MTTPFQRWRDQQRLSAIPDQPAAPAAGATLNPGRQARLDLAYHKIMDAYYDDGADSPAFAHAVHHAVQERDRLRAEELAELGVMPRTIDGCVAVLNVAARIIETLKEPT